MRPKRPLDIKGKEKHIKVLTGIKEGFRQREYIWLLLDQKQ